MTLHGQNMFTFQLEIDIILMYADDTFSRYGQFHRGHMPISAFYARTIEVFFIFPLWHITGKSYRLPADRNFIWFF